MTGAQVVLAILLIACVRGRFLLGNKTGHDKQFPGHQVPFEPQIQKLGLSAENENSAAKAYKKSLLASRFTALEPEMPKKLMNSNEIGYIRAGTTGVTVTIGASASLAFSISLNGIPASSLARDDSRFREALNKGQLKEYDEKVNEYSGGLQVPFLDYLGINLNNNIGNETTENRQGYDRETLVSKAREILEDQSPSRLQFSGSRIVTGLSYIPRTYYAYIRVAKVQLLNGSKVLIASSKQEDVAIATESGSVVDFGADSLQMMQNVAI